MNEVNQKYYIGIDVSKASLDIALDEKPVVQVANNEIGWKRRFKQLPDKKRTQIILEASGRYEKHLSVFLSKKRYQACWVNAQRVRAFANAAGRLAKTDRMNAQMIREFGKTFHPKPQVLKSEREGARESFIERREPLVKLIGREKQHVEQASERNKKAIT